MNTLLEIKNITKYYGSGENVSKALNGVSFTMEQGEFTAVMGASGSGKSTLLNVIATIDRPSSGSILLEGRDIAGMSVSDVCAAYTLENSRPEAQAMLAELTYERETEEGMETAVLIALVTAGVYAMYFLITYYISCGHVICYGAEDGKGGHR